MKMTITTLVMSSIIFFVRLQPSGKNGTGRLNNGGRRSVGAGREEAATECRPPEETACAD